MIKRNFLILALSIFFLRSAVAETQIWLAPMSALSLHGEGAQDYMKLVADEAAWAKAAPHISVFKLYPFFVGRASDADLTNIIDEMKRRGIALGLEGRALAASRGCKMDHGDGGDATLHLLQRVKRLGGEIAYFAMDEPLKHLMLGEPRCRTSLAEGARDVASRVSEFRAIFPKMRVGDIEPVGEWAAAPNLVANMVAWANAYQAATGEPMAFFHADVGWTTRWVDICADLQKALARSSIPFGMIYNGNDLAASSKEWTDQARSHFATFERDGRSPPSMAIFQSWVRYPTNVLPEDSPDTLTGVLSAYFAFHNQRAEPKQ